MQKDKAPDLVAIKAKMDTLSPIEQAKEFGKLIFDLAKYFRLPEAVLGMVLRLAIMAQEISK